MNATKYADEDLEEFFLQCTRMAPVELDVLFLVVEVEYKRGSRVTGEATIGKCVHKLGGIGYYAKIRIPKDGFKKRDLAWVFIHELHHCDGLKHEDMTGSFFHPSSREYWADKQLARLSWADKLHVRVKPKEETPLERYKRLQAHARDMVERYKIRQELVASLLNKWKRKLRYYTRKVEKLECPG